MRNFIRKNRRIEARKLERELGFGNTITTDGRMMNPDGSFNVKRETTTPWDNLYFHLITMPIFQFFALFLGIYVVLNLLFAAFYWMAGIQHFTGIQPGGFFDLFRQVFFFSSQTLTTVGYGQISPMGFWVNAIAALESFVGLSFFALISGLIYGRFARPHAKIVFSENLLVAPYRDGFALMFRIGNARRSELLETEAQIIMAVNQQDDNGNIIRRFYNLPLEIAKISFFSLSWTIVHAIREDSPLWGLVDTDLSDGLAEFWVLIKGTDEATQQIVHARRSYFTDELIWNAKFLPIIGKTNQGHALLMTGQMGKHTLLNQSISAGQ